MPFRADIQGLRAVAVVLVLLFHAGVPGFAGGFLGVDVFFVVSGYLIGGQLLASVLGTGRIDVAGFFARRARRILPAALVVIVATIAASLLLASPVRLPAILLDGVAAALSGANLRFALLQTDYLAGTAPSPFQHYWSLAVEEQFYLLAPFALLGLFALVRGSRRGLLIAGLLVVGASFAAALLPGAATSPWTFFSLHTRAWELGVGMLAAAAAGRAAASAPRVRAGVGVAGAVALVAGCGLATLPEVAHPGPVTALPVLGTAALLLAGPASPTSRVLAVRPAVAIGDLSYALYLVHWPLLVLVHERIGFDRPMPVWLAGALLLLAVPLAVLLRRTVELPALATARRPRMTRGRTIAAGLTAVAVVAGGLAGAAPALAGIPLSAGRPAADPPLAAPPAATAYVPSNLEPALRDAAQDTGALYADGCQQNKVEPQLLMCAFGPDDAPTIALFGDSHAGRLFPALQAAVGDDARIVTLTKSGCRSVESATMWEGAVNRSCAAWRAAAIEQLRADPPDVIVLANHVGADDRSADRVEELWRDATATSLARLPAASQTVLVAETPELAMSPPECLGTYLEDALACAGLRDEAVNAPVIAGQRAAADAAGATFVDVTDLLCGRELCPAVIGATLVYGDEHHLTATFSARLGPWLRRALAL